jgi:hypothetical protein
MKRVKAACILQTLVFSQKDDAGFTREQEDGSVLIHVRKQYNGRADVSEYFV